jgi:hypothetical protein
VINVLSCGRRVIAVLFLVAALVGVLRGVRFVVFVVAIKNYENQALNLKPKTEKLKTQNCS